MTVEPSEDEDVTVSRDPETDTYRATLDSATVEPTVAVVRAMAAAEEADPSDLAPSTRPSTRIASTGSAARRPRRDGTRTVEFTYQGRRVTVESLGFVEVHPLDDKA